MSKFNTLSRRDFFRTGLLVAGLASATARAADSLFDPADLEFLRSITQATIDSARVKPWSYQRLGGLNTTGVTIITPGGNYPFFWIRDYAMSLDCGLIGPDEMLPQLKLIAKRQNGPREKKYAAGGIIPPFAIADRIHQGGKPIYVPGFEFQHLQGLGYWGPLPPADDHYYFVHIAYALFRDTGDAAFLSEKVGDLTIMDRLIKAFHAVETDLQTGAVVAIPPRRMIGFGFNDTIYMLGAMSFVTLLRWRAARQLSELCQTAGRLSESSEFEKLSNLIASNLVTVFSDPANIGGWLRGATGRCREPDVWATLFAIHLGVLPSDFDKLARETVAEAVSASGHIIEYQGAVRQVPVTFDFSDTTAWEDSRLAKRGQYQNGAYWHTATGWLISALHPLAPSLAHDVFARYISHLRLYDFRTTKHGAPYECFSFDLKHAQNPVYMTSVTLPLSVVREMKNDE